MTLQGKKILLGICGSIAAYKSAFLTRLLIKSGAEVKVLMTPAASTFITPLTLSTLSKHPVPIDISSEEGWNNHVELGLWADVMLIAPATSTTLSKMASALCDNIVVASYLSARCPVFVAPAMDLDMWTHPATVRNIRLLQEYGNQLIPVGHGELASGLSGAGRMAEPEDIVRLLEDHFSAQQDLAGQQLLITAGPTHEPIDPVRFIGNRSTGKMGIALADAAAYRGAEVTLVLGPSRLKPQHPSVQLVHVKTAQQMYEACAARFADSTVAILAAAVADYRPKTVYDTKMKKKAGNLHLELERTTDIAATLGQSKSAQQLLIGFALETNNELENAKAKRKKKNFDFIVLNSLQDKGAGFQHDTNKISILFKDNKIKNFELKPKSEVASDILDEISQLIRQSIHQ
ncbi:MAG: bifunctional phosphopantothenoylcysteine decarboxylase/phosphopantothenate--cysteine ligase CoaBC [Bacteroidota bacterium]